MQSKILTRGQGSFRKENKHDGTIIDEDIPEDENATTVVIALGFDIGVCHQEYSKNNDDNVPSREDKAKWVSVSQVTGVKERHT